MVLRWLFLLAFALVACGGKGPAAAGEKKIDLDADPLALLPPAAVLVASFDARALFDDAAVGGDLNELATRLVPLGADAGFAPSRDVDRVVLGSYATGGVDVVAVVVGRFDAAKIDAATRAPDGTPIIRGMYAGWTTYAVGAVRYAVLTPKAVACGTEGALRRLLDRVPHDAAGAAPERSMPPWMADTLQTKGAQMALATDFSSQPASAAAVGALNLSWVTALRVARVVGNLDPPGLNVAATLTYADPEQAKAAAQGVEAAGAWLRVIGPALGGIRVQNLVAGADANDVRCKFAVDDETLKNALALAGRFLPVSHPSAPSAPTPP